MLKTTPIFSVDEDNTMNLWGAYPLPLGQDTLLRRNRSAHAVPLATRFVTLHAGVTALEVEAIQGGRLILREAAAAAGLDIQALAWQAIRLA